MSELQLPRWEILDPIYVADHSVVEHETVEIKEHRGDDLTSFDKYQLDLDDSDAWYLLGDAKVLVDFEVRHSGSLPTEPQGIVLQDGFSLFSRAELSFNGQEVEAINEPGIAHFYRHLTEYSQDYSNVADKQIWYPVDKVDGVLNYKTGLIYHENNLTEAHQVSNRTLPGGIPDGVTLHTYGPIAHNDDIPAEIFIAGDFYIFSSAGSSAGAGKFALGTVAVGDIAYYDGSNWNLVTVATQASKKSATLGSGWYAYAPENDHRSNVQHGYLALEDSGGDDISEWRSGVQHNPQYVASFDAGVRRLLTVENQKCILPLKELFGTLQTQGLKASRGTSMTIDLYKQKRPNAVLYAKGPGTTLNNGLAINIKKLSLLVPRVKPSVQLRQIVQDTLAKVPEVRQDYPCYQVFRFENISNTQTANRLKITVDSNRMMYCLAMFSLASKRENTDENPFQCGYETDVELSYIRLRNHDKEFPQEPYNLHNGGDLPRMYNDVAELFAKQRGMDNYNDGLFIDLDTYAEVHTIVGFNLRDTDPAITEQFRSSDLELQYNLSTQPIGNYDVTIITCSKKEIIAKHIGGDTKWMK